MSYNPSQARNAKGAPMAGAWSADNQRGGAASVIEPVSLTSVQGSVRWQYYEDHRTDFPVEVGDAAVDIETVLDSYDLDELMDEDGTAYNIDNDSWADEILERGQELGVIGGHPLAGADGASFGFSADQVQLQRYVDLRRATGWTEGLHDSPEAHLKRAQTVINEAYGEMGRIKVRLEHAHTLRARILAEHDGVQVARVSRSEIDNHASWGYTAFDSDDRPAEIEEETMLHEELLQLVNVDAGDDHHRFQITP